MSLVSKMVYFRPEEWNKVEEFIKQIDKTALKGRNVKYASMFRTIILDWVASHDPKTISIGSTTDDGDKT